MYLVKLETIHCKEFKICIEALKNILTEATIIFDEDGMKILEMGQNGTIVVHLRLTKFEEYYCKQTTQIGVDMDKFNKIISFLSGDNTLVIYIKEFNPSKLGIKINDEKRGRVTTIEMNLCELVYDQVKMPELVFSSVITMPSNDYQQNFAYFKKFSEKVEIKCVGDNVIFSCRDREGCTDISIKYAKKDTKNDDALSIENDNPNDIKQGYFNLESLLRFSKCADICDSIKILLKNNYPLVICFQVGGLGELKMCLAPILNVP